MQKSEIKRDKPIFFLRTFFRFREIHYLCSSKMTITLFNTKIVTEYKFKKQISK